MMGVDDLIIHLILLEHRGGSISAALKKGGEVCRLHYLSESHPDARGGNRDWDDVFQGIEGIQYRGPLSWRIGCRQS